MRDPSPHPRLLRASLLLLALALPAAGGGKGSDIGGPEPEQNRHRPEFGIPPAELSDAEKEVRFDAIRKEYESLKRNQDVIQTRTRRSRVRFLGEMAYPPAADFLLEVFEGDRDVRTQVSAMVALGQTGDPKAVQTAVKKSLAAWKKTPVFVNNLPRMFEHVRDPEVAKWLTANLDQREHEATAALVESVGHTGHAAAVPALQKLYERNRDLAVRFEALRAIGRLAGSGALPFLLPKLEDEAFEIRMAAAEGLGFAGDPAALGEVAKLVREGEEPIVVETAIEAVGRIGVAGEGTADAIPTLLEGLVVGRMRARNKARVALTRLARKLYRQERDYHVDHGAWTGWWNKVKRGVDPDDAAYEARETVAYYRFKIHSDRVLFILDVSGSMEWPDPPLPSRISMAHQELFKALRALAKQGAAAGGSRTGTSDGSPDRTVPLFNVMTFAGATTLWKPQEVPATPANAEEAIAWIAKMLPRGGTNTYDAVMHGLQRDVDTIFFLSDGVPSVGRFDEPETILSEIRRANRFRRVSINTIALIVGKTPIEKALKYEDPEEMAEFMSRIAEENYGDFADESRP